jgi:hypothetical protein
LAAEARWVQGHVQHTHGVVLQDKDTMRKSQTAATCVVVLGSLLVLKLPKRFQLWNLLGSIVSSAVGSARTNTCADVG